MALRTTGLGIEAIKFKSDKKLFIELTAAIGKCRGKLATSSNLRKSGMKEAIQKRTQLNVTTVDGSEGYNACVHVPMMDKNHPLIADFRRHSAGDYHSFEMMDKTTDLIEGTVSCKDGVVSGMFAKIPIAVIVGLKLLRNIKLKDAEIAAVVLHELGHATAYFEKLDATLTSNFAIEATAETFFKSQDRTKRIKVLDRYEELRGVSIEDRQALADEMSKDGFKVVLLRKEIERSVSVYGSNIYDMTGFEFLADQFATRHGAGLELVTALDKLNRFYGSRSYWNTAVFYTWEIVYDTLMLLSFFNGGLFKKAMLISLLFADPFTQRIYDEDRDRIERIRRDAMTALKDKDLSKEEKSRITESVKQMEQVMSGMKDKHTLRELIHMVTRPKLRKQLNQKEIQQRIEELSSSEFFNASARLSLQE